MKAIAALCTTGLCFSALITTTAGQEVTDPKGAENSAPPQEVPTRRLLTSEPLHRLDRLNGGAIGELFRKAAGENTRSVIPLESPDGRLIALATAVSENGYALTKASELEPLKDLSSLSLVARVGADNTAEIRLAGVHKKNDLALIKIAARLRPVDWDTAAPLKTGFWISAISNGKNSFKVGIVGAPPRAIDRDLGKVGVRIYPRKGNGVLVSHVFERSGASDAGLKSGDVVLFVAGEPVQSPDEFTAIVTRFDAKENVELVIERQVEGKPKKWAVEVVLGNHRELMEGLDRNMALGGPSSRRSAGFQNALQHDIPLGPEAMGGPLFSIDGKAVGLNIARRDRVTTFALPSKLVKKLANEMIASATGRPLKENLSASKEP
jgi:serine protease Do